jgi:hypothetical protein
LETVLKKGPQRTVFTQGIQIPPLLTITAEAGPGKSSSMLKHDTLEAPEIDTVTNGSFVMSYKTVREMETGGGV